MNARKLSCRLAAGAIALLLAGWAAAPAHARNLDFYLHNQSPRAIYYVYVTPASSAVWGRDILGRDVLFSGERTKVTFPGAGPNPPCLWDVKVIYDDRTSAVKRFDLCSETDVIAR